MQNEISYYTEESDQIIKDGDILLEEALENTRVISSGKHVSAMNTPLNPTFI